MHTEPKLPEFAELYTKGENIRNVVVAMVVGAIVVVLGKVWFFPWVHEFANSAPCRQVFGIDGLRVLWYGIFMGIPFSSSVLT